MSDDVLDVLDPRSFDAMISRLKRLQNEAEKGIEKSLDILAEMAVRTADAHYASGFLDENEDVTVTSTPIKSGRTIIADGEDANFLEFGSGVAAGNGYDTSVIDPPVSIEPKSWSSTQGTGEFAKYGSWHHNKRKYTMTVPRMGMYFGAKEVETNVYDVIGKVFNDIN